MEEQENYEEIPEQPTDTSGGEETPQLDSQELERLRAENEALRNSEQSMAVDLMHKLLDNAVENGAECVVTPCPLCQMNLDAYQSIASVYSKFKTDYNLPILFVTQLIGLALGIDAKSMGLDTNIASPVILLDHISKAGAKRGT